MPSSRTKLLLDEKSFQGLLAAAFTIQQYNERLEATHSPSLSGGIPASPKAKPSASCEHCGGALPGGVTPCPICGAEGFRSGERLQHTWALMWRKSQEQAGTPQSKKNGGSDASLLPSRPGADEGQNANKAPYPSSPSVKSDSAPGLVSHSASFGNASDEHQQLGWSREEIPDGHKKLEDPEVSAYSMGLFGGGGNDGGGDDPVDPPEEVVQTGNAVGQRAVLGGFSDLRLKLRTRRAELYLGIAVLVAVVALAWPATAPQRPSLQLWERALIAMGIAEAPAPTVEIRGDPNIKVWVDTHTALYYCPGDQFYGTSPDGHFSTQREAQSDRFEPAERSACVQ